jgi:hypothetical protein
MTIQIPVSDQSLASWGYASGGLPLSVDKLDDNLCAFLQSGNDLFIWRRAAISVADKKAKFESKRLGIFQLVYCGAEPLPDFKDAAASAVAGSASNQLVTINISAEVGASLGTKASHLCAGIHGPDAAADGTDKLWALNDYTLVSGTALEAKIFPKRDANLGNLSDDSEAQVFALFMTADQTCSEAYLKDAGDKATANYALAFTKSAAAIKKGDLSGSLGDEGGPFPLMKTVLKIGRPDGEPHGGAGDQKLCLESQWSGLGGGRVQQTTMIGSTGQIGGMDDYPVYYIPGTADSSEHYLRAYINSHDCRINNDLGEGASTATDQKHASTFWNFTAAETLYLTPANIKLELSAVTQLLAARLCMRFYGPGTVIDGVGEAAKRELALSTVLLRTAETTSYRVYLPFVNPKAYDIGYKLAKGTEGCHTDLPEKADKNKLLQPDSTIKDANVPR